MKRAHDHPSHVHAPRSPAEVSVLARALLSGTLLACSSPAAAPRAAEAPVPSAAPIAAPSTTAPSAEPLASASAAPSAEAPAEAPLAEPIPELARFHAALRALEKKERKSHVRVYWMGDSHGQADFWSGALREGLQQKAGAAGPGFLHLGYKDYRHDGVKIQVEGRWRMRPKRPAGVKKDGDGVVGLGGFLMGGYKDQPRVEVELSSDLPGKTVVYDLCYRLPKDGDAIDVTVDGKRTTLTTSRAEPHGVVRHAVLRGSNPGKIAVRPTVGSPDFCGVAIESDPAEAPGVVVDTLGINGARYATALSWDEKAWQSEVARRPPDLVVLEYGTNEAGDPSPAYNATGKGQDALLARIRAVKPDVDCVVVSATDRADVEEHLPPMNASLEAAAKRNGCYFFDAYKLLGGKGAAARLREESPPRVQKDGIHLTVKGYRELGRTMFDELVRGT
jgi:lysophospholipase L1-like esterase